MAIDFAELKKAVEAGELVVAWDVSMAVSKEEALAQIALPKGTKHEFGAFLDEPTNGWPALLIRADLRFRDGLVIRKGAGISVQDLKQALASIDAL